jgi:glycosyltransferase involved in cell wall biosynthesis
MDKKTLLICLTDMPFPARKNGISIRYFPIIAHASKTHNIHLLIISDAPINQESVAQAKQYCSHISVYERRPKNISIYKKIFNRLKTLLPFGVPFTHLRNDETEICAFIHQETQGKHYAVALCVLLHYFHLIQKHVSYKCLTLDLIDSPYSTILCQKNPTLWQTYDAQMIKRWERRALQRADYSCYISLSERRIGAGDKVNTDKVGVIPNGLFLQDWTADALDFAATSIGYIGHMGFVNNINAALRLANIFERVKKTLPTLKLIVIGRDPAEAIRTLGNQENIILTGAVENIWPFVNGVTIFVFPLEWGIGQRNKILEAMGAGKAVICTHAGNRGIGAAHGKEIMLADTDEEIERAIILLSSNEAQRKLLGAAAQKFIMEFYHWENILPVVDKMLLHADVNSSCPR